jgi:hypothetical protein
MADLTADAYIKVIGEATTELWILDSSAAQTVYKGQPMIIDQSADTVNLRGFVDATVVAATDVFMGIAAEGDVVASGDRESDHRIQVYTWPTIIAFKSTVYTNADLGATVYMSDSGTLSSTAADNPQIGKLHRVEDGYAQVQIISPQICTGA